MASLTMKGKKDFTTKKTSKVFHRKGHYEVTGPEGKVRKPYRKARKQTGKRRVSKLPISEDILIVSESPMAGGTSTGSNISVAEHRERAEATTETDPDSHNVVVGEPGLPTDAGHDSHESGANITATGETSEAAPGDELQHGQEGGRKRRRKSARKAKKGGKKHKTAKRSKSAKKGGMCGRKHKGGGILMPKGGMCGKKH
jgi:hypothetical protein